MRGKRYRYYISQNLLQYRDHPKGVIARIPAYEIEIFVHNAVLDLLRDHQKAADMLGLDTERDYKTLNVISKSLIDLTDIVTSVQRVVVDVDMLTIKIRVAELCKYLSKTLKLKLDIPEEKEIYELTPPYITKRALKGVVIIRPDKKKEDLFDLPPQKLRNLIRGFVWRAEHFKGKTIRQIAETEGFSDAFVGRLITSAFEAA